MSVRDTRNQVFESFTPAFLGPVFAEHGREIATGLSLSRDLMAPYLFWTALNGRRGKAPTLARAAWLLSDGLDGFIAEHDTEFHSAQPTISSHVEAWQRITREAGSSDSLRESWKRIFQILGEIDGSAIDPKNDWLGQTADQLGGTLHGDVSHRYLGFMLARTVWNGQFRNAYAALGLQKARGSVPMSQLKTVLMGGHQGLEAAGVLDRFPRLRQPLEIGTMAVAMASVPEIMVAGERGYLHQLGYAADDFSYGRLLLMSTLRTVTHINGNRLITPPASEMAPTGARYVIPSFHFESNLTPLA